MTANDHQPSETTDALAAVLGIEVGAFADVFGAGWLEESGPVAHDFDADPSGGGGYPVTPWHIAGNPPQLMLRVFPHGVFVARPEGVWRHGTHGLGYEPSQQEYVAGQEVLTRGPDVVRRLLSARRRTFRYCRYCYDRVPPERRIDDDLCMGCATAWHGVVY